jgi:hypothetical protein
MATYDGLSLAEWEALRELPVEPYVGLALPEAEAYSRLERRHVRVLTSLDGPRRLDLDCSRVNVALDAAGVVMAADAG